jgi:hypothetical protein
MTMIVYIVSHNHGNPPLVGNEKFVGTYATKADAEAAESRASKWTGFSKYPEGFRIYECPVDQDHWTKGFTGSTNSMLDR